ncbi:hypothetical protein SLNSH_24225, partial [Alsobacter soli]
PAPGTPPLPQGLRQPGQPGQPAQPGTAAPIQGRAAPLPGAPAPTATQPGATAPQPTGRAPAQPGALPQGQAQPQQAPTAQPGFAAPQQQQQYQGQAPQPGQAGALPPSDRRGRLGPAGAAALGAAAGFVGGYMASEGARSFEDVRQRRREVTQDGVTVIQEPGRQIIRDEDNRVFLRHDETERFRELRGDVRTERRGSDHVTIYERPDGDQIVTVTDDSGRLLRRYRRDRGGRETVIIDNTWRGPPRSFEEDIVELPPPPLRIPRERYIVDADNADENLIYETIVAPPVAPIPRRYTLDEVRYSPDLRARMRSVDVNTINFETASWEVTPDQVGRLATIAQALNQAIRNNPSEVFLIEGHTDAVGSDVDNLSLSDRRAQSVAAILTRDYQVPPENLTTQGYGEQYLKVNTQAPSRENRRVTVRRITPLLQGQNGQQQPQQ